MPFCSPRRRRSYRSLLLWTVVLATGLAGGRAVHAAGSGTSQQDAGLSCKTILNAGLSTGDGLYWIDPNGGDHADAFQAYCDMTTDGGGWTLAVNSVTGEEPTTTDMTSNTGVVAENRAHTRNLANLAINNDAQIRYFLDDSSHGRVFHAKYTGRYHNPLPASLASWTALPGYLGTAEDMISYHFGRGWTTSLSDRGGGSCPSVYIVSWYYGACWVSIPTNAQNGFTQGPVTNAGTTVLARFAIFVREVGTLSEQPTHVAPSFGLSANLSTGGGPTDVAIGDFDSDGRPDIVTANTNGGTYTFTVRYGNGNTLQQAAPPGPHLIATGHFTADNRLDFVLANANGQITAYINQTTSFTPISFSGCVASGIATGDFDKNGTTDIALACSSNGPLIIASGNGAGSFSIVSSLSTGTNTASLAVADLNSDGELDIVVTGGSTNCFNVFVGGPAFGFGSNLQCSNSFMGPVAVGDWNGDNKPDLVVGANSLINSLVNNDGVHFTSAMWTAAIGATDVALLDVDNDLRLDAIVAYNTSAVAVGMGTGTGAFMFSPQATYGTSSPPRAIALDNMNSQGGIDIVTADNATDSVSVFLNSFTANLPPAAEDGSLTVIEGTTGTGNVHATDPENHALTYALTSTGSKGTATLTNASTGAYSYAANPGESGTDTFTFTASDGVNTSAPGTITVTITPKHTPQITWLTPAPIGYGTVLGAAQLNATADVDGMFSYAPVAGTPLGAGPTQTLSVTFTPTDSAHYSSTSASVLLDVLQAPLTVRTVDASIVFGQPVPSFTVTYDGFVYGETPAALGGTLTFTGPASTDAGSYPITPGGLTSSNYAFDFQPGTLIIAQAPTTTSLSASPPTAGLLQPVKLTATVGSSAAGAGVPTGTVRFHVDGAPVGTASLSGGVATLTVNGLTPGAHAVTATYDGTLNFGTSTSAATTVTVRPASQSAFTLAFATNSPTAFGQRATLAALVVGLGGGAAPTGSVAFVDGATLLGTAPLSGGVAQLSTTALSVGPHFIFAVYLGNATFGTSVSSPAVHNVFSGTPPLAAPMTVAGSGAPTALGDPVTFTITISPASGTPTGTVVFLVDNTVLQTATVSNQGGPVQAHVTTNGLSAGVHLISAIYIGDGVFGASGAGPIVHAVQ